MKDTMQRLDYETFLKMIDNIPSCIFFKDTNLRYQFCTHKWEQLNTPNIIGKTDVEIRKDTENAMMAMEMDKNIIRSGKGCSYVIKSDIDNHIQYLELIKEPVFDDDKVIGIVGLINDVTEKTILQQKLKEIMSIDSLTQLYSRQAGVDLIVSSIEKSYDNKVFLLFDLNDFKKINDTYGHQTGDEVLHEFGYTLKRSIYDEDIAVRLGGDEFIVLLNDVKDDCQVQAFVTKLHENMSKIKVPKVEWDITVSIGATYVKEGNTFESLYATADRGMYKAKADVLDYVIEKGDN